MDKSAKKSTRGKPFAKGGDPRQGTGPAKGAPNAGRPPDQWKASLRALADRQEVLDHIDAALAAGPSHPFFSRALDYVTDHGYGKAASSIDVTTKGQSLNAQTIVIGGRVIEF